MWDRRAHARTDKMGRCWGRREEAAVTSSRLLVWILGFSVLGSVGGVAAAALFLVVPAAGRGALLPVC